MANKFQIKQWEVEELGRLYSTLEERYKDLAEEYRQLDEMEQRKEWNSETRDYELVWEDEEQTIPKMTHKWGYVTLTDDELSEERRVKRDLCEKLMAYIEKQL